MDSVLSPAEGSRPDVSRLKEMVVGAVLDPNGVEASTVTACESILTTPELSADAYDWAVRALGAVLYTRPDLVGESVVVALTARLAAPRLPPHGYRLAGEVLTFLLATESAPAVVQAGTALLARDDLRPIARRVLRHVLNLAVQWRPELVDLETAIRLVEREHPVQGRDFLREHVVEPCIFADPSAVTPALLERLTRLYARYPAFAYLRYSLCHLRLVPAATRVAAAAGDMFPVHEVVARHLRKPGVRVLVIQNIADGQGDEIIRTVPLVQAFLDVNPDLAVVLVTKRVYLYAHPRVAPVPIDDRERVVSLLEEPFDVVVDFFESTVLQVNHDPALESLVQAAIRARPPFIHLHADKGYNHFDYRQAGVEWGRYDLVSRINRQHVANVYAPTFRLIAELGLPLRAGEDVPASGPVLAAIPNVEAEALWARVTARNTGKRRVALVNPFGGAEPLKGYTAPHFMELAERIRGLIDEGFFVVLLPNGEAWGTAVLAHEVLDHVGAAEDRAAIAPDPRDGASGNGAAEMMKMFIYFAHFANLVVAVEGWMVHAAYCLGTPYRVLMLPYSHGFEWHPYGRTRNQRVVCGPLSPSVQPSLLTNDGSCPPPSEQPRKSLHRFVLTALGECLDPRALPTLCLAARSDDRDLRLTAVEALARYPVEESGGIMRDLLRDTARRVRAAAAAALLRSGQGSRATGPEERAQLQAYVRLGAERLQWEPVLQLGAAAGAAVVAALEDDDPVVRREAAVVHSLLTRGYSLETARPQPTSNARRRRLAGILPRRDREPPRTGVHRSKVLILTPVKDAADYLDGYCERVCELTYPHDLISVGFLESDSTDDTYRSLQIRMAVLRKEFRRAGLWKRDFGFRIPAQLHRSTERIQVERRSILARSRNHLLSHALDDEDWVLWLDVDVIEYPADIIERLLATGKDIVQPHCVLEFGGRTFDTNGWREEGRLHLDDLRGTDELVQLDSVGGTVLLVRADLHRDGLVFPPFLYGQESPRIRWDRPQIGEIETEGLGIMAHDMGHECWGMPALEVRHDRR